MPDGSKTILNWIKISDYDLDTAVAMLKSKRYLYVAFTCQQCIEKLMKALYVRLHSTSPPYTHNLIRLSELAEIENDLNKEQREIINTLNAYYIKTRYSEELEKLSKRINKKNAEQILTRTQKLAAWLKKKI